MSTPIPKDIVVFKHSVFESLIHCVRSDPTKQYSAEEVVKILENAAAMVATYIQDNGSYQILAQDTENKLHIFDNQVFNFSELDDTIVMQYLSDDYSSEALADVTTAAEVLRNETGKMVLVLPSHYRALKAKLLLGDF